MFYSKVTELADVEVKGLDNSNLVLEHELRLICNVIVNFCLYNNDDPSVIKDFVRHDYLIEETCLAAIKYSLDTSFVPVRKIILIFHIYIRFLFGEKQEDQKHKERYANLKYIKDMVDYRQFEKTPRYLLESGSPVEQFYKRNTNKSHPIPHVIVVGILRVLLSSCPNTKKNTTGGVCIHREWSSCIKLYFEHKQLFDDYGFKSQLFEHETIAAEYQKL